MGEESDLQFTCTSERRELMRGPKTLKAIRGKRSLSREARKSGGLRIPHGRSRLYEKQRRLKMKDGEGPCLKTRTTSRSPRPFAEVRKVYLEE